MEQICITLQVLEKNCFICTIYTFIQSMASIESVEEFSTRVVNHLKTNGMFDEFRQQCAEDIEKHVSFPV